MDIRIGIDASQPMGSCAVSRDGMIVAAGTIERPIENMTELIRRTLKEAGAELSELTEIVSCIGPGSQTGIRTTVVTCNALGLALGIPVTGIMSLDALAALADGREHVLAAVSAGRRRWFTASYTMSDGKLSRIGEIGLVDELPEGENQAFTFASSGGKVCAEGLLVAAESQRQLIEQDARSEVRPYESPFAQKF
ncbi:MAG: tRNA (adenosine(37)-N6)-threonylcarbamoyltransferase complex dimerization subunit type 1 TsaB [Lachnospiraceae bacterium]|nr:tRNA (adenosine(37)-N6)-threonylcarbamoyltransferase complex dimerization subunit type 1 TsaB [Lachnospiraceae bacterium]